MLFPELKQYLQGLGYLTFSCKLQSFVVTSKSKGRPIQWLYNNAVLQESVASKSLL